MNPGKLDTVAFRRALGNFATGITVVTAKALDGTYVGITANSFNSVSLEPPLILWSLDRRAYSLSAFEEAEHFTVNLLSTDQVAVSNQFATKGHGDKFAGLAFREGIGGAPIIGGCAAHFQCRKAVSYDGGDHRIYIGEVLRVTDHCRPGLLFHRGAYAVSQAHPVVGEAVGLVSELGFPGNSLGFLLSHAMAQLGWQFDCILQSAGVGRSQWRILCVLGDGTGGMSTDEISAAGLISSDELGAELGRLMALGWIDIAQHEGTINLYSLTPAGTAKLAPLVRAATMHEADSLGTMSAIDAQRLKNALRSLLRTVGAERQMGAYLRGSDIPGQVSSEQLPQ